METGVTIVARGDAGKGRTERARVRRGGVRAGGGEGGELGRRRRRVLPAVTMTKVVVLVVVPQRWRWVEMRLSEVVDEEGGNRKDE